MTILAAGLVLGVAASLHCAVMCGPLTLAILPRRNRGAAILYHGARLMTYSVLGAVIGVAGHLAVLTGLGRLLSVIAGLTLIGTAARRAGWLGTDLGLGLSRHVTGGIVRLAGVARSRWRRSSPLGTISAGILNGLLPCGPVYAALIAAVALGDSRLSASFMLAFGLGTLPALAAAGTIAAWAPRPGGRRWGLITPALLALLGVLLSARGLIPLHHDAAPAPVHGHATHGRAANGECRAENRKRGSSHSVARRSAAHEDELVPVRTSPRR